MNGHFSSKDLVTWKPTPLDTSSERRFFIDGLFIQAHLTYAAVNDANVVSLAAELVVTGGLFQPVIKIDRISAQYTERERKLRLEHQIVREHGEKKGEVEWAEPGTVSMLHLPFLVEALVESGLEKFEFQFFDVEKLRLAAFERRTSHLVDLMIGASKVEIALRDGRIEEFEFPLLKMGKMKFRAQE
ncbi:MAG: hypothetical protein JNJ49_01815 [Bdellovibrionaceae bacterium]|nr:hypothetical protein [Pseudobdellovibrionaceae bacterium]